MPDTPPQPADYAANVGRGFLMGAADIVPGVSGGTVALVLGIYRRLLTAISHVDGALLGMLAGRRWRAAADHVDLRFLLALALGILAGVFSLARLMSYLLSSHREATYAAFFGLILASGVLVGKMCRPRTRGEAVACVFLGVLGAAAAFALVSQNALHNRPGLAYTFVCGCIAICAMILPGISGSYLLVLLGKYEEITGIVKDLPHGAVSVGELLTLGVFACGCVVGLLVFSRLLRWLLGRHGPHTMAVLCGFMIGSLYKIWPFQRAVGVGDLPLAQETAAMRPQFPESLDAHTAACFGIMLACFAGVLVIDAIARWRAIGSSRVGAASDA